MRQLRFRFWDIKNKRFAWVNPSIERLSLLSDTGYYQLYGTGDYIVTQYTGMSDKNHTPIYGGDVYFYRGWEVRHSQQIRPKRIRIVDENYWIDSLFMLRNLIEQNVDIEIIGNIFEKPELKNLPEVI